MANYDPKLTLDEFIEARCAADLLRSLGPRFGLHISIRIEDEYYRYLTEEESKVVAAIKRWLGISGEGK